MSETIQRQIDELSALKAIFSNDLRDLRHKMNDNVNNWSPIEVEITLKPMISMSELNKDNYVQLDLYVKCGKRYPNVIPDEILLKNVKGLSAVVCDELRAQLYELAKTLRGEVMIYEFTDNVRQYLHKHNRPPNKSFYDEMLLRENKLELQKSLELEKQMESIRIREEIKRKQLEEELQRKQMALQEESRLRRESREDIGITGFHSIQTLSSVKCSINHKTSCITFLVNGNERQIQKGKCIFHNHLRQSIEYLGIDLFSGEPVVIIEWIININQFKQNITIHEFELMNDNKNTTDIVNRISKIENFFKTKMKCLDHSNLIRYLSMQYSIESDYIVINLLQEYVNGNSLYNLANVLKGQPFDLSLIRFYSKQILEVLNYLHKHLCPHGDLKQTNIYIDSFTGNIKISGYYLEKQIYDLFCDLNCEESKTFNSNMFQTNIHRLMMKDIYQFGLIVNAISNDWNFTNDSKYLHLKSKVYKHNFDNDFHNFLEKCIDSEENARWNPESLLQHSFILSQKTFTSNTFNKDFDLKTIPISNGIEEQPEDAKNEKNYDSKVLLSSIVSTGMHSRLANEFEVLDELGKGH